MRSLPDVILTQEELDELLLDLPQIIIELEAGRDCGGSKQEV